MSQPINKTLYEQVKKKADTIYKKPSAYKSGYIVQEYKRQGGKYRAITKDRPLADWFKEDWKDVNPNKTKTSYPVYRPTKIVNKRTPLTASEIDKKDLLQKAKEKQKIKGSKNLSPFKKKK